MHSLERGTEVLLAVIGTPGVTLLSKRGALQVLLAWKLMCVCPPEDLGMGRASVLVQP